MGYRDPEKARAWARLYRARPEVKARRRAHYAKWRAANKEWIKAYMHEYYITHKAEISAKKAEWKRKNREKCRASNRLSRNFLVDPLAPKVNNPHEMKRLSTNPSAVHLRRYRWKKKLLSQGFQENTVMSIILKMERRHEYRRKYLRYCSIQRRATSRYRSKMQQEEQARLALAMTGG